MKFDIALFKMCCLFERGACTHQCWLRPWCMHKH